MNGTQFSTTITTGTTATLETPMPSLAETERSFIMDIVEQTDGFRVACPILRTVCYFKKSAGWTRSLVDEFAHEARYMAAWAYVEGGNIGMDD